MGNPLDHESYRQFLAAFDDQHAKLSAATGNAAKPLAKLREALGEATRILDEQAATLAGASDTTRARLETFRNFLAEQGAMDSGAAARIEELEAERARLVEAARANEARFAQASQELSELRAAADAARGRASELESHAATARHEAALASDRVAELEQTLAEKQSAEADQRAEHEAARADADRAAQEAEAARKAAQRAADERDRAREELTNLQAEFAQLRERAEGGQAAARERDRLAREAEGAQRQIAALNERIEGLQTDLAARVPRDRVTQLEDELRLAAERMEAVEQRLHEETAKGTKSMLAQQLAEALREAEQAREELRALRRELGRGGPAPADTPAPKARKATAAAPPDQLTRIRAAAEALGRKRSLGEILVNAGVLAQDQLDETIEAQRATPNIHLGELLVERGIADEAAVAQGLACQCGVDFIQFDDNTVDPEAAALISRRLAQQHTCIPLSADAETVILAMRNPLDLVAIEDVERATSRKAAPVVAPAPAIRAAIEKYYWEPE